MSSTPITQSATIQRLKQRVYVDIPSSPVPLSRYSAISKPNTTPHVHAASVATSGLKENTPLPLTHDSMINTGSIFRKRKLSERDVPSSTLGLVVNTKKQKLTKIDVQDRPPAQTSVPTPYPNNNFSSEYPNGFLYCHQCARKYDVAVSVQCTMKITSMIKDGTIKERRCGGKFCGKCLKSRYGENIDEIKSMKNRKQEHGHVESTTYTFKCPKCRDICNCWSCRRSKGLEPMGKLNPVILETGAASAAQVLVDNPKRVGLKVASQVGRKLKAKAGSANAPTNAVPTRTVNKELAVKKQGPLKPLPPIEWTSIATNLNLEQAEMRFQIREFMLRFACIMEPTISKTHLEELDNICSSSRGSEDMAGWVSETCVRAILLGVLYLLIDKDNRNIEEQIRATIKDIRASGANLNKMWLALMALRESLDPISNSPSPLEQETVLSFPDPLPPPSSTIIYNTRNMRNSGVASVQVANSAQMVPVLNAFIEAAFDTDLVREELEKGVREGKEITREVRECIKKENDRWDIERKRMEELTKKEKPLEESTKDKPKRLSKEMRSKREAHKQRIQRFENTLKLVLPGFAPRFAALGRDDDGHVFYALSPGVAERKAALDFITSETDTKHQKNGEKKERAWSGVERSAMKEWSWFVGVWAKRPSNETNLLGIERAVNHIFNCQGNDDGSDTDGEDEDEGEDTEKWWGFHEPKNIRNVAEWIAASAGTDDDTSSTSSLVKGLKDYAALLEWRAQEDKYNMVTMEQLSKFL